MLVDTALRRRLTEGALQTGRERRWDEVYDRLLDDYRDTIESRGERLPASLTADLDAETSTSVQIGAG